MCRKILLSGLAALLLFSVSSPAQNAPDSSSLSPGLQRKIEAVAADPALRGATVSLCVETADGRRLVDYESRRLLVPSSNLKLITTGAALKRLGKDYRFQTRLCCDGTVRDSVLKGDVFIIGGADPTLGSVDAIAIPEDELFGQWRQSLLKAGIREIDAIVQALGVHIEIVKD